MKLTFLGATHEVTGSCSLLQVGNSNILIDCGLEQGENFFENRGLPMNPAEIDCVLLTHAHIDHSGKLPLLYKEGFRGTVYATDATSSLCDIMLRDSAHIQMFEADWKNRKAARSGRDIVPPLYDMSDAEGVIKKFRPCPYGKRMSVLDGLDIQFTDIGHLLGSACIEIWINENGIEKKIVFSGDIGNKNQPIINDPHKVSDTDYLVIESTYGDRVHEASIDYVSELKGYIQKTLDRGGNVVIPSFAVGRTQELLYFIRQIKEQNLITGHPGFPVYVDSPLANEATGIFLQCPSECFDSETNKVLARGENPLMFDGLTLSVESSESIAINSDNRPKVIISASGMCEAGRIRHHLKHNLWRKENLILFVGYQAANTLGRIISDGAKEIKLFGEEIAVKAEIASLHGISGHADKPGLIDWISGFKTKPAKVFVNHGEDSVCDAFVRTLSDEYGYNASAPYSGSSYDLTTGKVFEYAEGIRIEKQKQKPGTRADYIHSNLMDAINRLTAIIRSGKGLSTKEMSKLTSQITQICDRIVK